jgi:hypothetical protein
MPTSRRIASWRRQRSSRGKLYLLGLKQPDKLAQFPYVVSDARLHRWRDAQRGVNPAKVVVDEVYGAREPMVAELLAESIGESGKSAHLHPDGEVVSLRVACANVVYRRVPAYHVLASADALTGTILAVAAFTVELDQHAVVNPHVVEGRVDRRQIRGVAVCRELNLVPQAWREVHQETVCSDAAPVPTIERGNQFRGRVNGNPRPAITAFTFAVSSVSLFASDKAPYFVALDLFARKVNHNRVHEGLAGFTEFDREPGRGALADASDSSCGSLACAFHEAGNNPRAFFVGESIHSDFQDGSIQRMYMYADRVTFFEVDDLRRYIRILPIRPLDRFLEFVGSCTCGFRGAVKGDHRPDTVRPDLVHRIYYRYGCFHADNINRALDICKNFRHLFSCLNANENA